MKKHIVLLINLLLSIPLCAQYAIYAEVSSTIVWLANPGQSLKKDEPLVKLDARLATAKLAEQQAILSIKQQQFADKKLVFGQIKQLFDNLVRSKRELDLAEIDYKEAKYQLTAQKSRVMQQQLWLEKHQILAPFDLQVKSTPELRNVTNHRQPKPLLFVVPINPTN